MKRKASWPFDDYTGLFLSGGEIPRIPSDPDVFFYGAELPKMNLRPQVVAAGGVGWFPQDARAACVGEGVERIHSFLFPQDGLRRGSFDKGFHGESLVDPQDWVLFHSQQYAQPAFPFIPLGSQTECDWICMRHATTGAPWWVPSEFVFLHALPDHPHLFGPIASTGLACATDPATALLRGTQEVIERDALMGAWWQRYPVVEYDSAIVWDCLGADCARRAIRPSLQYRFFHIQSPYSHAVTMVTLSGQTEGGFVFTVGSACRETRSASFRKSLLEAIQGLPYVRFLKNEYTQNRRTWPGFCADFPEHAVYYSLFPERLESTLFGADKIPSVQKAAPDMDPTERLGDLVKKLGESHPVLFRNLTSPCMPMYRTGLCVVRVLIPGLQPMHGSDVFAWLGGPMWQPRTVDHFAAHPPHPFP